MNARGTMFGKTILLLATLLPALLIALHDARVPTDTRAWAALLWVLCMAPCWARSYAAPPRRPFPFLPVIGLLYGGYYALPISAPIGVLVQGMINLNPATDYDLPVFLALGGWVSLLAGYLFLGLILGPQRRPRPAPPMDSRVLAAWGLGLLWFSLVVQVARGTVGTPQILGGFLTLIASMGWFGAGLLVILLARGRMDGWRRAASIGGIVLSVVAQVADGAAAGLVVWAAVIFLSIALVRGYPGHRWAVLVAVIACCALVYRGIKAEFTNLAWYTREQVSTARKMEIVAELTATSVREHGVGGAVLLGLERSGRWGTIDIFADVVRNTPDHVPYWNGATYRSLVGALVPRILWPGKPAKRLGNDFGHRYHYLILDDFNTSINLPFLVEFYANFAVAGVLIGMMTVGFLYHTLERRINRPGQDPLVSVLAVAVFVPLFNIESDFSLIFGGIVMAGAVQWVVLRTIRHSATVRRRAAPRLGEGVA